jgi:hypothetical protein
MTMRNAAVALLALLAFGVAWPPAAQAGCADHHGIASGRGAAHLDGLALAGALSPPISEEDSSAPVPRCSGLHCSNDPTPFPPAGLTANPGVEQWGLLAKLASYPDNSSSPLPCDACAVLPEHRGVSPFHPPR